jgi:hypothetical protein
LQRRNEILRAIPDVAQLVQLGVITRAERASLSQRCRRVVRNGTLDQHAHVLEQIQLGHVPEQYGVPCMQCAVHTRKPCE